MVKSDICKAGRDQSIPDEPFEGFIDFELGEVLKDLYSRPLNSRSHVLRFIEDPMLS